MLLALLLDTHLRKLLSIALSTPPTRAEGSEPPPPRVLPPPPPEGGGGGGEGAPPPPTGGGGGGGGPGPPPPRKGGGGSTGGLALRLVYQHRLVLGPGGSCSLASARSLPLATNGHHGSLAEAQARGSQGLGYGRVL